MATGSADERIKSEKSGKEENGILDTSLAASKKLPYERFPNNRSAVCFDVGRGPRGVVGSIQCEIENRRGEEQRRERARQK